MNTESTHLPNENPDLEQSTNTTGILSDVGVPDTTSQLHDVASPETANEVSDISASDTASEVVDFTLPKNYKPSILVIDDMTNTDALLAPMLQEQGMAVHSALTGEEGIKKAMQLSPDLILLDVELSSVHGFDVCKKLSETKQTATIPVIMITGKMMAQEDMAKGFAMGAVDYVVKPFFKDELIARINTHVELARLKEMYRQQTLQARVEASGQRKLNLNTKALVMEAHANLLTRIHRELNKVLVADSIEHKNLRLKRTQFLIQQELQMDVNFADLEKRFRSVNMNYQKVLLKHCPALSPKEIQLCMLLRLGYSTKQICRIQGVLAPSVDAYRYRVRLKLKLTKEDNLVTHLVNVLG